MDHDKWQWQEPGTAWRGVGLYHITLTVTSRQPLLGALVIPNNDPAQARIDVSPFGRTLTNLLWDISKYQPDIQMLHYALMPDHLHFIWYIKRPLTRSIREVVSGFWVGAKKLGRAYSYNDSSFALTIGQSPFPLIDSSFALTTSQSPFPLIDSSFALTTSQSPFPPNRFFFCFDY